MLAVVRGTFCVKKAFRIPSSLLEGLRALQVILPELLRLVHQWEAGQSGQLTVPGPGPGRRCSRCRRRSTSSSSSAALTGKAQHAEQGQRQAMLPRHMTPELCSSLIVDCEAGKLTRSRTPAKLGKPFCLGPLFFFGFAASWSCASQRFLLFASVRFSLFALLVNASCFFFWRFLFFCFFALLVLCFFAPLDFCFLLLFPFCFLP